MFKEKKVKQSKLCTLFSKQRQSDIPNLNALNIFKHFVNKTFFRNIFLSNKKMNTRSCCLARVKDISNNDSINDWKMFEFVKIKTLNLRDLNLNKIENHPFIDFENLEELDLCRNKLTKIESNSFQYLNKLKRLYLIENQIKQIDSNGFQGLENLEYLNANGFCLKEYDLFKEK